MPTLKNVSNETSLEGLTRRELSELAGVREPTTYSALLAMEKAVYITRKRLADNMRNLNVNLMPAGRALEANLEADEASQAG